MGRAIDSYHAFDGTIYVLGDSLVAVGPGGSIRWNYPLSRSGATPILGADGTVYFAGLGRAEGISALDSDGRLLWDHPMEGAGGSPIIRLDGIIIAAAEHELVAIVEHSSTNGGYAGAPWPTVRGDRANTGSGHSKGGPASTARSRVTRRRGASGHERLHVRGRTQHPLREEARAPSGCATE